MVDNCREVYTPKTLMGQMGQMGLMGATEDDYDVPYVPFVPDVPVMYRLTLTDKELER